MKVVRAITRLNIGGPAQQAVLLNAALERLGWKTHLVFGALDKGEGSMEDLLKGQSIAHEQVPSLCRPIRPFADLCAFFKLLQIFYREKPDIIHTHTAKAGLLGRITGLIYRLFSGRKVYLVHTFHGHVLSGYFNTFWNKFFRFLETVLAAKTDCPIVISAGVREGLQRHGVLTTKTREQTVPLGLPLDPFFALEASPTHSTIRIGLIGRLVPIKNHKLFLSAISHLLKEDGLPPLEFWIVGDGELREELEAYASSLNLEHVVTFKGWQRDLPEIYRDLDIVCLTSINEGTPVSIIEAMASARPVVSTDVGGVKDLLGADTQEATEHFAIYEHGLLLRLDAPDALAQALIYLIEHPEQKQSMSALGRNFVKQNYTMKTLSERIHTIYNHLLEG